MGEAEAPPQFAMNSAINKIGFTSCLIAAIVVTIGACDGIVVATLVKDRVSIVEKTRHSTRNYDAIWSAILVGIGGAAERGVSCVVAEVVHGADFEFGRA